MSCVTVWHTEHGYRLYPGMWVADHLSATLQLQCDSAILTTAADNQQSRLLRRQKQPLWHHDAALQRHRQHCSHVCQASHNPTTEHLTKWALSVGWTAVLAVHLTLYTLVRCYSVSAGELLSSRSVLCQIIDQIRTPIASQSTRRKVTCASRTVASKAATPYIKGHVLRSAYMLLCSSSPPLRLLLHCIHPETVAVTRPASGQ